MRDRTQRPELEQALKPTQPPRAGLTGALQGKQQGDQQGANQTLQPSPGVEALTSDADWSDADTRHDVSYEVFLEQLAHDMAYEDKLSPAQEALLKRFGYSAEPSVDGPFGFQMRVFTPGKPEFQHLVIAFRGTEFTSAKDLQSNLSPQGVGHNQFRANQRRIQSAIQQASLFGRVWVTGHSLGGALAQLTAATYSAAVGRVITFQSPSIDAYSVKQLEAFNRSHPEDAVASTHYQVAGDVVSSAGERLTPGEVVQFELKPSNGSTAKTMTAGMLAGVLIGPASGMGAASAMEAIAKHRAFPVSNAAEEHPAFRELFEEGKTFERIAGISRDTFEARKPISSEIFKNSTSSNFLRGNIGRGVFAIEKATSDWGKDAKAREWAIRNRDRIHTFHAAALLEQLGPLLSGWVSDDDVSAFEAICFAVRDPKIMVEIRSAITPQLEELHSDSQRRWIEDAIRHQPKITADNAVQRDQLAGSSNAALDVQPLNLGSGSALETAQRERLEAHFGANLTTVRVISGEEAAEAAANYSAKAFTQGEHIVLGRGVTLTDELAGHEVAHVMQQRTGIAPAGVDSSSELEVDAQRSGQAFAQGDKATRAQPVQAQPAMNASSVQRLEGAQPTATPITITFSGQSAREETFSAYSRGVLEDILRATGVSSCTITSTTRTPHDQARIFYQQLTGTLKAASYAAAGEAVKTVGRAAIKQKKSRDEVIALMEAKIRSYDPMSQVSKHLADPAVLNVFDVAPSSIPSRKREAFVSAVNADARVNKFLHPGNSTDPAYHIEVPQSGTAAAGQQIAPARQTSATDTVVQRKTVQRKVAAKTSSEAWTKNFSGKVDAATVSLHLTRTTAGDLSGTYQLGGQGAVALEGKILQSADNDLFLKGADGSAWHGRYTGTNTLLFGNVQTPTQRLAKLELQPTSIAPSDTTSSATPNANTVWQRRLFAATLTGTDGDRRIDFTLNRSGNQISGSFSVRGTGHGNITKGEFDSSDKASPLKLECQFTDRELAGQTRVLEGWFLYAEGGARRDENNDGKDDSSKTALPLLIGGIWKGGTKDYKLEPISPSAAKPGGAWSYNSNSGSANFTEEVGKEVLWAANELGVNPNDLAACISFESAGSFSPSQTNNAGGAAIGLIQFLPPSLNQMGQYLAVANGKSAVAKMRAAEIQKYGWEAGKLTRASLITMDVHEQMRYVVLHFKAHRLQPDSGLSALYQKIIAPFSNLNAMYTKGSSAYSQNKGLDADKDGVITADEAASVITRNGHAKTYFSPGNDSDTETASEASQSINAQSQTRDISYTITTMTSNRKVNVKSSALTMRGAYPTVLGEAIAWQGTKVVNPTTAAALAEVRGVTPKNLDRSASHTASEFLAVGADYANKTSGGVYQVHTGWDLNVFNDRNLDKPAFCAADGVVVFTGDVVGFRKTLIVYHPQLERWTRYAHLESYSSSEGSIVNAGDQVGVIGDAENTQPAHLHFDVIKRLESAKMWNGAERDLATTKQDERDYNQDSRFDVNDRIEYVKDHYEDPQAFFAKVGVAIPKPK